MYQINERVLKNIINDVIDDLQSNTKQINRVIQIDEEVCGFKTNLKKMIDTLNAYKTEKIIGNFDSKLMFHHYGNPYITAMVCMRSLIKQDEVIISTENICVGMNELLISMINEALKEERVPFQIHYVRDITMEKIHQICPQKLICLGNQNAYSKLRHLNETEVVLEPFWDLVLYYDSEDYDDLVQTIVEYSNYNFFEIEVLDNTMDFEEVKKILDIEDPRYACVILSRDEKKQEILSKICKSKFVFVNDNPFGGFEKW